MTPRGVEHGVVVDVEELTPVMAKSVTPRGVEHGVVVDIDELTPVEGRAGVFFKRDDLFQPFAVPLNGGKVRQALHCFTTHRERIRSRCNNTVATVSSVHSPQGYLIAKCAHSLGFKTLIGLGVGDVESAVEKYPPLKRAREEVGAELISLAKIGYNSVLQTRLNRLAAQRGYFPIHFGIPFDLSANARQVENLPKVDNLVIPCGSGVSAASIFVGLRTLLPLERRPGKVHVIQIAGNDRRGVVNARMSYDFIQDKTYPYSRRVDVTHDGLELDNVYESKAFHWLLRAKLRGSVLFWVIGNFNKIRAGAY